MQNLYLLQFLSEAFRYHVHHYQYLSVPVKLAAHGTRQFLLKTQVCEDFSEWCESSNIIFCGWKKISRKYVNTWSDSRIDTRIFKLIKIIGNYFSNSIVLKNNLNKTQYLWQISWWLEVYSSHFYDSRDKWSSSGDTEVVVHDYEASISGELRNPREIFKIFTCSFVVWNVKEILIMQMME